MICKNCGTELEEGQAIKIYVSSGPDMVTAVMMDVVGKDKAHAVELLNAKGFSNVRTITIASDEPAGKVVSQSETAGEEIDVTTEIFLEISEGPEETKPQEQEKPNPQPDEEQTPPEPVSKVDISFALPDRDTSYTVTILRDGVPIISDAPIEPGTHIFSLSDVEGSGTSMFELWVDGQFYSSHPVEF